MGSLKNCIQYLPSLSLYNQTRTLKKGTKTLSRYRCARGSTSLESFHLHLNRFIPSEITVCGSILILLTGTDSEFCMLQVPAPMMSTIRHFSQRGSTGGTRTGLLRPWRWMLYCSTFTVISVNQLSQTVQGNPLDPAFQHPRAYTGELIGVEYWQGPPSGTIRGGPITKKRTTTTTRDSRKKTQKTIPPSRM